MQSAYHEGLKLAVPYNLRSIVSLRDFTYLRFAAAIKALSAICTGICGYPIRAATHIALDTVLQFWNPPARKWYV